MRRILSRLRQQRGQVLIMFAALFTIITIIGVVTVDFGLWFSERRGAQTDADLPALAGARECMLQLASGVTHDPYPAIEHWFDENNGGNAELVADKTSTQCEPQPNGQLCVDVVVKHNSKTLFSSFFSPVFDGVAGNIGAHARACAGAANGPASVDPLETDTDTGACFDDDGNPIFTGLCGLEYGSGGGPGGNNPRGIADLSTNDGVHCSESKDSGKVEELLACGAPGMCIIDDTPGSCAEGSKGPWFECASTQTGNPQKVLDGVQCRLDGSSICQHNHISCDGAVPAGEGHGCDTNHDGIDSFEETVQLVVDTGDPTTSVYEPRDCEPNEDGLQLSPRLMNIIVFDQYPDNNNDGYSITGFAGFYIVGCASDKNDVDQDGVVDEDDIETKCDVGNSVGHIVVYGQLVKLLTSGTGIGPVNPSSTEFGIALVDWESGGTGGTPGPTSVPTVAPTTPPPPTPTPCPCGVKGNGECKPCH
jgi:hypothetical protein